MQVFQDLYLNCSADQMARFVVEAERAMPTGWRRDAAEEARVRSRSLRRDDPVYCFSCAEATGRPAASVFLAEREPGLFYASNVVPEKLHQLEHEQYNAVLRDFYERVARPAAERCGVRAELTDSEVGLEHWMSRDAAEKLRMFSACANKSSGSAHPADEQRWMDFIVAAQRDGSRLDATTLRRWLIEVEGWPPEVADGLASEYDFGKDILAFAAGQRVGA